MEPSRTPPSQTQPDQTPTHSDTPSSRPPAGTVRGAPVAEPTHYGVNLEIVPAAEARIGVLDIGFRRGFAAFDSFRLVGGVPVFIEDHLARFERSAELLGLELPVPLERLRAHLFELIETNDLSEAGVQMFLTGGFAADGFTPTTPNLVTVVVPLPQRTASLYDEGAALITREYVRDMPEVKSTNYAMAVTLAKAMKEASAADALYHDGVRALETTRSSLFLVTPAGRIVTPGRDILPGVTRLNVLRALAETGDPALAVEERDVALEEVFAAREAFITSTTKGALPIVRVDDQKIGDGAVGPVTRRVREVFAGYAERYLDAHGA